MQTWTFPECRPPGVGPWQDEPDKAQWVDEQTGLDCLIVRTPFTGALCGYVGVPPGHPLHGAIWTVNTAVQNLDVHGGINYGAFCDEGATDGLAVCHLPEPGRPADVFWFGFDTAHSTDYAPTFEAHMAELSPDWGAHRGANLPEWNRPVYRTFDFVRDEVAALAAQVHAVTVDA